MSTINLTTLYNEDKTGDSLQSTYNSQKYKQRKSDITVKREIEAV